MLCFMSCNKIVVYGAGGQGKNVSLLIEQLGGWEIVGFLDDDASKKGRIVRGYQILGSIKDAFAKYDKLNVALAIGNSQVTEKKVKELRATGKVSFPNLIHPSVVIDNQNVKMGEGNVINANCVFTTLINIGSYNYFNRCCSVSHDVVIGDYCFVHSGVHLSGESQIGNGVWFGVNSTIVQCLKIGDNALIGAGAVILKDVEDNAIMVGNPAKVLRYK